MCDACGLNRVGHRTTAALARLQVLEGYLAEDKDAVSRAAMARVACVVVANGWPRIAPRAAALITALVGNPWAVWDRGLVRGR